MGILYNMSLLCSFISLILLGYSSIQVVTSKCMTEPYPTNCRFPFTYNGETYDECTKVDNWEFLGVPLIPMVMETAQIVPGPIVRCQKSASSQPLTRVSPTTNAPLLK